MTYDEANDAMLAIIKGVGDAETVPLTYTDVPAQVPDNDTTWARATVKHATGRQGSLTGGLGTTRYERRGTLWVQLFAPIGAGGGNGRTKGQVFVNTLQQYKGSVWFRNVRLEEMGADGAFQRFDVKADFEYDDVR